MKVIYNVFEVVESLRIGTCYLTRPLLFWLNRCTTRTPQLFHLVLFDFYMEVEFVKLNVSSIVLCKDNVIRKNLCLN